MKGGPSMSAQSTILLEVPSIYSYYLLCTFRERIYKPCSSVTQNWLFEENNDLKAITGTIRRSFPFPYLG